MQQTSLSLPTRVQVGQKVLRIQRRLGNGAFGVVYKVILQSLCVERRRLF